jgi:molybdopterin converting factor subunit 1
VTVRVLFFAYLRERCGVRETTMELPAGATVSDLWRGLVMRYEGLPAAPPRFAVNRLYVDKEHTLHDNDELALIPPVSGGSQ